MSGIRVTGVGMHPFGRHGDATATEMGVVAVRAAIAEAGIPAAGSRPHSAGPPTAASRRVTGCSAPSA